VRVDDVNWLGGEGGSRRVSVKLRSAQPPVPATVTRTGREASVLLDSPAEGVAPGQACVFYEGDRVLGGGWIRRAAMPDSLARAV
jgi:tRNA-specific 2-thiouridylase